MNIKQHMIFFNERLPDVGQKFIALYDDGSGANLYLRIDDALTGDPLYLSADGMDDFSETMDNYLYWIPLPDDYKFSFEELQ